MIISRYLHREVCAALLAITTILLLIFLSNQFIRYLSDAAAGKMAVMTMLHLMSLEIPRLLGMLLPLGLFLGILLAYGRLYTDSEMTVLAACGMSRARLVRLTLPVIFGVMIIVALLTLWVSPAIQSHRNVLLAEKSAGVSLQTMLPGRFQESADGRRIFYMERVSVDRQKMHNIFIAELAKTENPAISHIWNVLSAENGYQYVDPTTGANFIVTVNGHHYAGIPGNKDFHIIDYEKYWVRTRARTAHISSDEDAMSSLALWQENENKRKAAELQWRLSMPVSALLLALLAIPLSQLKRGQGKYAKFFPSILIYIIYANMLFVSRVWVSKGTISTEMGMWSIHAGLLLLIVLLSINHETWHRIWRRISS